MLESEWHENECYVDAIGIDCDEEDRRMDEWSEWKEGGRQAVSQVHCNTVVCEEGLSEESHMASLHSLHPPREYAFTKRVPVEEGGG